MSTAVSARPRGRWARLLALAGAVVCCLGAAPQAARELNLETFDAAWSIIEQTHWDLAAGDWQAVREELRPRAAAATSRAELRGVLNDMLGRLRQSHFAVLPRGFIETLRAEDGGVRGGDGDPGFETILIDGRFVVSRVAGDGPAAAAGVQLGWVVRSVDGADVAPVAAVPGADEVDARTLASEAQRGMDRRLSGIPGEMLQLVMLDGADSRREVAVRLAPPQGQVTRFGNLPPLFARLDSRIIHADVGLDVGLIGFNIWLPMLARPIDEAVDRLRDTRGMVLDLRGNPGGLGGMVMGIGGHFVDEQVSLGTMRTRDGELNFVANPRRINPRGERVEPFAGPLAILIDNTSASTSEVFAGGMQAIGRARVFGQRSMGAALASLLEELPNGDILQHAVADFVVAGSGVRLEGRGVLPDELITVTRADLLAGRDPTLDAAIEWMTRQTP